MNPITQFIAQHFKVNTQKQTQRCLANALSEYFQTDASHIAFDILRGNIDSNDAYVIAMILGLNKSFLLRAAKLSSETKKSDTHFKNGNSISTHQNAKDKASEMERVRYYENIGPHIKVICLGRVTQVTFAAMTYHSSCILRLRAEIVDIPITEQIKEAGEIAKTHSKKVSNKLRFFGEISSYLYCPSAWISYPLNTKGHLTGLNQGKPKGSPVAYYVEGKPQKLNEGGGSEIGFTT